MDFLTRLKKNKPLVIDGGLGTLILKSLPNLEGPFEKLNLTNPKVIENIHQEYVKAGAEIIETNTFGANKIKLAEYGLGKKCEEINEKAALIARAAVGNKKVYVGGSMGSTGLLIEPIGEAPVEKIYDSFLTQIKGLVKGGVDLIIIETMNDLQEAKLALLATKNYTNLPIIANLTFEEQGQTITGTDILTGLATLSELGANVVGANCSMGPAGLLKIFRKNINNLKKLNTPLSVWSNAGMPEMINGEAVYKLTPKKFAEISLNFAKLGIKVIGGCCGTTPDHIAALKEKINSFSGEVPLPKNLDLNKKSFFLTSRFRNIDLTKNKKILLIGERLNPTARKAFAQELPKNKTTFLRQESQLQKKEGADLLDLNVGVPSLDEVKAIHSSVNTLTNTIDLPLMIDSDKPEVIDKGLLVYPGIPFLNSINGTSESLTKILPLAKKYGCAVVALCLDKTGIHVSSAKRIKIGESLLKIFKKEKIDLQRIFIDPLTLAESAEPGSALETLKVIKHFSQKGIKTIIGLSNISFGLPGREAINNVFLKMAMRNGLTAAIVNPAKIKIISKLSPSEKLAFNFLSGLDSGAKKYLASLNQNKDQPSKIKKPSSCKKNLTKQNFLTQIYQMVLEGNSEEITDLVELACETKSPEIIMNQALLKGLEKVGDLYSTGEYFLPQMIASAKAMKNGFKVLQPKLAQENSQKVGTIIICTVKGDVHDIGKNIVSLMLENHGFEVHDIGKDVSTDKIISEAKKIKPDIICLSSLLTTTMNEMKKVKESLEKDNLKIKLLIGGAVITDQYAKSIGSFYGQDAAEAVKKAHQIIKNQKKSKI